MSEVSKIIKEFSKINAPKERTEVGVTLWEKRREYFSHKQTDDLRKTELHDLHSEKDREYKEFCQKVIELEQQLESYNISFFSRIKNIFTIRKLRYELEQLAGVKTDLEKNLINIRADLQILDKDEPRELKEAEKILDQFYQKQESIWRNLPYDKEDVEKYFSENYLSELSIDDYILLLQRFPAQMVTHVTRQGFRDHSNQIEASFGFHQFHNGFKDVLEDGRLRSFLALQITEEQKRETILKFLFLNYNLGEKKAIEEFLKRYKFDEYYQVGEWTGKGLASKQVSDSYADKNAVHFAVEEVADIYYGAESGNEIFFTFPSLHVASQYYFSANHGVADSSGNFHNDLWTWHQENRGFNINAGLVFIPADARVDKNTGSKYKLDDKMQAMNNADGSLVLADEVVSSQEYWEKYFIEYPDKKPNKVIFYTGGDPSAALLDFRQKNNLNVQQLSLDHERHLGFAERQISQNDLRANLGLERYINLVIEMIDEYYTQQKTTQSTENIEK